MIEHEAVRQQDISSGNLIEVKVFFVRNFRARLLTRIVLVRGTLGFMDCPRREATVGGTESAAFGLAFVTVACFISEHASIPWFLAWGQESWRKASSPKLLLYA